MGGPEDAEHDDREGQNMDVEFGHADLGKLAEPGASLRGLPPEAAKGFRKALVSIRAALDERDLYRGGLAV